MNLNDKLKQERTGLTASQYSDLKELFVDRYVDGMSTKDLVEYVYNDMNQYVDNQPEQEFLDDHNPRALLIWNEMSSSSLS